MAQARAETVQRALATRGPMEPVARREDLELPGAAGPLAARLYGPPRGERAGLLVYFHGGGHVIGDLTTCESVCRFLSRHAGVNVLAVDYRLAPEHPFPAAADDATASLRWAAEEAESLGADPGRIAVGRRQRRRQHRHGGRARHGHGRGPGAGLPAADLPGLRLLLQAALVHGVRSGLPAHQGRDGLVSRPLPAGGADALRPAGVAAARRGPVGPAPGLCGHRGLRPAARRGRGVRAQRWPPPACRWRCGATTGWCTASPTGPGMGRSSRDAMLEAAGALRLGLAG